MNGGEAGIYFLEVCCTIYLLCFFGAILQKVLRFYRKSLLLQASSQLRKEIERLSSKAKFLPKLILKLHLLRISQ